MQSIPHVTVRELAARHTAFFVDAYGVLVDSHGPLPGAARFIDWLNESGKAYALVTNDASRLPETMVARFANFGLAIPMERIVSSGDLVAGWMRRHGLVGKRCAVLGPPDSHEIVRRGGGVLVPVAADQHFDAFFIGDESGFDFLPTIDAALSMIARAFDAGEKPKLVVPNPDLVYPKKGGEYGIAAGSIAGMLERALTQRFAAGISFTRLGKPFEPIFAEACARAGVAGNRDAVMIGDQAHTDIQGANKFGIASALLGSGIARVEDAIEAGAHPTYLLSSLGI